jgi:hypothetical protein
MKSDCKLPKIDRGLGFNTPIRISRNVKTDYKQLNSSVVLKTPDRKVKSVNNYCFLSNSPEKLDKETNPHNVYKQILEENEKKDKDIGFIIRIKGLTKEDNYKTDIDHFFNDFIEQYENRNINQFEDRIKNYTSVIKDFFRRKHKFGLAKDSGRAITWAQERINKVKIKERFNKSTDKNRDKTVSKVDVDDNYKGGKYRDREDKINNIDKTNEENEENITDKNDESYKRLEYKDKDNDKLKLKKKFTFNPIDLKRQETASFPSNSNSASLYEKSKKLISRQQTPSFSFDKSKKMKTRQETFNKIAEQDESGEENESSNNSLNGISSYTFKMSKNSLKIDNPLSMSISHHKKPILEINNSMSLSILKTEANIKRDISRTNTPTTTANNPIETLREVKFLLIIKLEEKTKKLQRIFKAKKKLSSKIIVFWDKKEENLITLSTEETEGEIKKIIICAYSKKLEKSIEKMSSSMELFGKEKVKRNYVIQQLEYLQGKD